MRQPRPRFRDFAEDFVSDGSAGEDKGAGLYSLILSCKKFSLFFLFLASVVSLVSDDICFDSRNESRPPCIDEAECDEWTCCLTWLTEGALINGEDTDGKIDSIAYTWSRVREVKLCCLWGTWRVIPSYCTWLCGSLPIVYFSPGTELKNTVGKKVSPALSARGCQHLAKGVETRTPTHKNTLWMGNHED